MSRANLPYWPRRLKAPMAAAYLGLSRTKFFREIEAGVYPQGEKDGGNRFWYLEDLDAALDRKHGRRRYVDPDDIMRRRHARRENRSQDAR